MKDDYKDSVLGEIPVCWDVVKLEDITSKISDGIHTTPKYVDKSDCFFINGNNLNNGKIQIVDSSKCVDEIEFLKHKRDLDLNTVLISINGTIGNIAFYNGEKVILGKSAAYIKCSNLTTKKFIFYQLQSERVNRYFAKELTGTTIKNLSLKTLKNTPLSFPPLPEQQKIADILTTVDDKLENIESQIAEYTNLKTGLMQQLLTKGIGHTKFVESELGMIPEEWEVKSLSSLTSLMTNGFVGTATTFYTDEEDGIIYIQGYNVEEGKFRLNGIKRVSKEFHNKHLKSCLQTGDVLTIQTGDVGVSAVVNEELTGANCHALIISRPITNLLNSYFLSYFLNSQIGKTQIKSIQVGSTMLHINVSYFLKYKIPLPKLKEQQKIVEILSSVDDKIESLLQKMEEFTNMKKGLMEQLLTGRIRVKV